MCTRSSNCRAYKITDGEQGLLGEETEKRKTTKSERESTKDSLPAPTAQRTRGRRERQSFQKARPRKDKRRGERDRRKMNWRRERERERERGFREGASCRELGETACEREAGGLVRIGGREGHKVRFEFTKKLQKEIFDIFILIY